MDPAKSRLNRTRFPAPYIFENQLLQFPENTTGRDCTSLSPLRTSVRKPNTLSTRLGG